MSFRIPISDFSVSDAMKRHVADVLASDWLSPGKKVQEFERKFAGVAGVSHAVMVNSGTDALRLSLLALKERGGWKDGDEVIVPASTFVATVNIVKQAGLEPVLVDIDPYTWVLEGDSFIDAVTERTRAIIPVHLFGLPADMPRIVDATQRMNLAVLEDSCESMGVGFICQWGDETGHKPVCKCEQKVGSYGDMAAFSTYACHLICTGVGGIITTNDDELAQLARSYANHGRDPYFLGGLSGLGKSPKELIQKRFLYHREGYSSRISEFEAAVGIPQIDDLPSLIKSRFLSANDLRSHLWEFPLAFQKIPVNRESANMMFPVVIEDPALDRDEVCLELEDMGIETRPALPLVTQPVYKDWIKPKNYPNAHKLATRGFYIGCWPEMPLSDVDYIAKAFRKIFAKEACVAA